MVVKFFNETFINNKRGGIKALKKPDVARMFLRIYFGYKMNLKAVSRETGISYDSLRFYIKKIPDLQEGSDFYKKVYKEYVEDLVREKELANDLKENEYKKKEIKYLNKKILDSKFRKIKNKGDVRGLAEEIAKKHLEMGYKNVIFKKMMRNEVLKTHDIADLVKILIDRAKVSDKAMIYFFDTIFGFSPNEVVNNHNNILLNVNNPSYDTNKTPNYQIVFPKKSEDT